MMMGQSIEELLDALSESGIEAEDEGSPGPSPTHDHDETITTHCTTLLADVSPSSTTTFATQSIDALVAKAGPPPLPPLPFRSHTAATSVHLVDVDYCRIQVECITLSIETPQTSSRCHSLLKNVGKDAQLCLRYELPPLTSNPEIAAGGAEAIVVGDDNDNGKSLVVITVGDALSIYPLLNEPISAAPAKASIPMGGRAVSTTGRRIKSKSKIVVKPSTSISIKTAKAVDGGGLGKGEIRLKHSNLLAIAFVTDKDVASWGGSFTIDLVCTNTSDADPLPLASCRFPLDDVLSSRSLDVRMQLDLIADKVSSSSSSSSNAVGSLVARVTLIGGNSCAEEEEGDHDQHLTTPTNTRLPIIDSSHRSDQVASPPSTSAEDQPKLSSEPSQFHQTHAAQQQHEDLMPPDHGTQPYQTESILPTTTIPPPLNLPPTSLPAPAPNHRQLDHQPTLHPSDTRVALERQLSQNNVAAHRIQTCIRKHLVQRRRQRRKKEEEEVKEEHIAEADLDVDSPPPPPPPPTPLSSPRSPSASSRTSQPQQSGGLLRHVGASCDGEASNEPFTSRSCDVSSLGESSPPTLSTEDIGSGPRNPSAAEGQLQLGIRIRLGSCKGLSELVSTWQEPGVCLFESSAVVAVSYTIFSGLDGLEETAYSKALPLHPPTSSFDFDSEQMVAISLHDARTIECLKNESLQMKLWILPASHSTMLQNEAAFDSAKSTNRNLLATANMPLAPLLDCCRCAVGGHRQIVPWKPKGWLGGEYIGSLDVAIYRAGVKVDQLQPYSEDVLSIASAVSIPHEEDKATREDNLSSSGLSASSASPNAFSAKEEEQVDGENPIADSSSASSSRPDSETGSDASGSSDTASPDVSSSCSGSGGSSSGSSSAEEEIFPGDVHSLSVVMESLESVKKSLSYHFDGQCASVNADGSQVDGGEDNADISQGRKEQYDNIGGTSNNCSTLVTFAKTSSREATSSDVKNEDDSPTTTSFVDVGTSPIDLGADNATDCSQAAPADAISSIANEGAASQTDTIDETPNRRPMAERCHKSTNTIPMHSPSSSSTESSNDGDLNRSQSLANTCSTTNPQIQRDFTSSSTSTGSTFRRRRRLFSSSNKAVDYNAVGCTISSPITTTSRALSRARIPVEYRSNRFNQPSASPSSSFPTTRSRHLSSASADRISGIMSQYSRPSSGILLGRSLYESSSSSDSCSSSIGEEDGDSSNE